MAASNVRSIRPELSQSQAFLHYVDKARAGNITNRERTADALSRAAAELDERYQEGYRRVPLDELRTDIVSTINRYLEERQLNQIEK